MSNGAAIVNPLPAVRRIVTGHNAAGEAVHVSDETHHTEIIAANGRVVGFKVLYTLDSVPTSTNDGDFNDPMLVKTKDLSNKGGLIVRVVDFAPGGKAMMHRTSSVDYGVVISGEITHVVDSGEEAVMRAGDVILQRGTMHAWSNRSSDWVRMHFVLVAATPANVNGTQLDAAGYNSKDVSSGGDH